MSKRSKLLLVMGILALLGTAGWGSIGYFWGQPNGAKYRLAAVERGDLSAYVSATGTLNPVIVVQVGTQVSGTIEKLFADYNTVVREGQIGSDVAEEVMRTHKVKKLPLIDERGALVGLITAKDLVKQRLLPFATRDAQGRLRVGAAIGAKGDYLERAAELIKAGVDVLDRFGYLPNDEFALYDQADFRLRVLTTGGFSPDGVRSVYPTEFVVRTFLASYPGLRFTKPRPGQRILDGRHRRPAGAADLRDHRVGGTVAGAGPRKRFRTTRATSRRGSARRRRAWSRALRQT